MGPGETALFVGAVSLGLLVGLELIAGAGVETPAEPATAGLAAKTPQLAHKQPPNIQEWTATVMARPLFSPTRRPVGTGSAGDATPPRLTAVLITPAQRLAIFVPAGEGKPLTLTEGGRIGPFLLQAIEDGQVTLAEANKERVVRPSFASSDLPAIGNRGLVPKPRPPLSNHPFEAR